MLAVPSLKESDPGSLAQRVADTDLQESSDFSAKGSWLPSALMALIKEARDGRESKGKEWCVRRALHVMEDAAVVGDYRDQYCFAHDDNIGRIVPPM